RHLLLNPLTIYKLVPLFCPSRSVLHQQFHYSHQLDVSISGIVNESWNDNLARITLPNGDRAWQIICAGRYVAVLGSTGTIFIWDSSNFAAVCTVHHHEPVTSMCFNNKGDKLVTYGLRSTKLWAIPLGQFLLSTTNPAHSKAMAIVFAEGDRKILVAGDDKVIHFIYTDNFDSGWQVLDPALLKEVSRIEGTVVNSPMRMAFNGDATQVGVCYRGFPLSVWSLTELRCIAKCRRAKQFQNQHARPSTSWFAVDRFTWNPITGHVIGIYRDGRIFKWHPITDEYQEVQSAADEVAASSDGKLFVTSNSNGTVKVWSFTYFSVIYQLSSADLVTGLAFSPDCRRFYDLRGSSVNAWESNSLIRFSEAEETFSDAASEDQSPTSLSQISEARLVEYEAVSIVAAAPKLPLYCFGNEEGAVDLVDIRNGKPIELMRFLNFLSVTHLSWSDDGNYVAAADLGGDIIIKRVVLHSPANYKASTEAQGLPSPKVDLEGRGVHQIMFNHDSSLLLVVSEDKGQIWGVQEAKPLTSATLEKGAARRWLKHPFRKDIFMGFGEVDVIAFAWDDFKQQSILRYQEGHPRLDSTSVSVVNKAIFTQDRMHILAQLKDISVQGRISKRCLIFDASAFDINGAVTETIIYSFIPPQIATILEIPLGILPGSRLAFLDQDLWMCTYKLGAMHDEEALQRHYFIPRDWVSTDDLEQCSMMEDGTFLCPKDDKDTDATSSEFISQNSNSQPQKGPIPYTTFASREKRSLTLLLGLATITSPLTATIYFPLLPLLRAHFNTSAQAINLTLTIYIIFQALSPAIFGPLSDSVGRRPVYLFTLSIYVIGNLGLALNKHSYAALLTLRALQSLGASAAFAVSYGVVADVCVPSERGAMLGPVSMALNLGACVGPVIGGWVAFTSGGFEWAFWALVIVGVVLLVGVAGFLPETARSVVGNGEERNGLGWWKKSLWSLGRHWLILKMENNKHSNESETHDSQLKSKEGPESKKSNFWGRLRVRNPFACLLIIFHYDTFLTLWMHGSFYTVDYSMVAAIPDIYKSIYRFNELQIGLSYLPRGAGIITGGYCNGKLMDYNYRTTARKIGWTINKVAGDDLQKFPLEQARSRGSYWLLLISTATLIGYGWAVTKHSHVSVLLILQFVQGFWGTCFYTIYNTLLVDVFPESPSTAAAAASITRCAMAATGVAILHPLLATLGRGWYFTILGVWSGGFGALAVWFIRRNGMKWRTRRQNKETEI
ncbi:MFS general substrate transporter, partial [Stipitochalara longipes BDJ]